MSSPGPMVRRHWSISSPVDANSQDEIARYQQRMGWEIPWFTLVDDFDADFGVGEWHGTNASIWNLHDEYGAAAEREDA